MIERYSDHAANERTFLAWVRTAVAIMGFGFLVEKFDIFLKATGVSFGVNTPRHTTELIGNLAGLALFVLGGAMMALAIVRFRQTSRDIDAGDQRPTVGARMDMALVTILALLGATLFGYLIYTTMPAFSE